MAHLVFHRHAFNVVNHCGLFFFSFRFPLQLPFVLASAWLLRASTCMHCVPVVYYKEIKMCLNGTLLRFKSHRPADMLGHQVHCD